jgi:hypothetical protein
MSLGIIVVRVFRRQASLDSGLNWEPKKGVKEQQLLHPFFWLCGAGFDYVY